MCLLEGGQIYQLKRCLKRKHSPWLLLEDYNKLENTTQKQEQVAK